MKVRRILVLLAALLVFVGSAPTAMASAGAAESGPTRAESGPAPRRSPTVATLSAGRRSAVLAPAAGRRFGAGRGKLRVLGVVGGALAQWRNGSRVEERRDARSLRSANAPHRGRGPPALS